MSQISLTPIQPINKTNLGENLRFLYLPDFEQDYPTYPDVINEFITEFSDTNTELLLFIEKDDLLEDKLTILDSIFESRNDANCYINLHIGKPEELPGIFPQIDAYITNRSLSNISNMDWACLYHLPVYSCVSRPIFRKVSSIYRETIDVAPASPDITNFQKTILDTIKELGSTLSIHQDNINRFSEVIAQLSTNQ